MNSKDIQSFMDHLANANKASSGSDPQLRELENLWTSLPTLSQKHSVDETQCSEFAWFLKGYQSNRNSIRTLFNTQLQKLFHRWNHRSIQIIAAAACCVLTTLAFWQQNQRIEHYRSEIQDLKTWLAYKTIDSRPSTERIQAIQFAGIPGPDTKEDNSSGSTSAATDFNHLFTTLRTDPSVNVRLAVIQSLRNVANHKEVRVELEKSLPFQTSDMVLMDIAQLYLSHCTPAEQPSFIKKLQLTNLDKKRMQRVLQHTIPQA